ncbi:NAD(P)/FAD-dependent oxidoreductase [Luteimonas saliphila]|uniref:NAD(P)/FAD-dependent oxidoreductase n=1 Tax=Luteimonas saliphila TaxID=2804919 RepID=UPI00192D8933|nr:FAD-dependent oxidoreductase [Luteimonas saliphila]
MSEMPASVVVVGAGQAGCEAALELRRQNYTGRVTLVGEESHPPYRRPPLSKDYLLGRSTPEALWVMAAERLRAAGIEFIGGRRATAIERAPRRLRLDDGRSLDYGALVLATGGGARPLPVAGSELRNVFTLRTIADADRVRAQCAPGRRAAIVGGGFVGLEVAAALRQQDLEVTLLEAQPRVLARVASTPVSTFFERIHREAGVDLRTGASVAALEGERGVIARVRLAGGGTIAADLVVVGIGLVPATALAREAGLEVDDGIVVDACGRTGDPAIFAAGDCTRHPSPFLGGHVRLESVQNAMEQARCVARNLLGREEPYDMVPWFWSEQYALKLQMVGMAVEADRSVVRGDPASGRDVSVFHLRDGRLIAAETVGRAQEFMVARKLVVSRASPDPARLADEGMPLRELLPGL